MGASRSSPLAARRTPQVVLERMLTLNPLAGRRLACDPSGMMREVGLVVGLAALSGCQAELAPKPEAATPPANEPAISAPPTSQAQASAVPAPAPAPAAPEPSAAANASAAAAPSSAPRPKPAPRVGAKGEDVRPVTPGALRD